MIYSFKIRLLTIVGLVAVSLVIALGRSFQLQVLEGHTWKNWPSPSNRGRWFWSPSAGRITDRNGRILAISIPVKSLYANPKELESAQQTARILAPRLGLSYHKLNGNFPANVPSSGSNGESTPNSPRLWKSNCQKE